MKYTSNSQFTQPAYNNMIISWYYCMTSKRKNDFKILKRSITYLCSSVTGGISFSRYSQAGILNSVTSWFLAANNRFLSDTDLSSWEIKWFIIIIIVVAQISFVTGDLTLWVFSKLHSLSTFWRIFVVPSNKHLMQWDNRFYSDFPNVGLKFGCIDITGTTVTWTSHTYFFFYILIILLHCMQ